MTDPFDSALSSVEELRDLYPAVLDRAVRKDIGHIDELCRRLIGGASMLFVATVHRDSGGGGGGLRALLKGLRALQVVGSGVLAGARVSPERRPK